MVSASSTHYLITSLQPPGEVHTAVVPILWMTAIRGLPALCLFRIHQTYHLKSQKSWWIGAQVIKKKKKGLWGGRIVGTAFGI